MTHTPYKTLRAKSASGNVAKAHLIHDDPSYPNGMYGVAHVYGDSDEQANQMAQDLATRYNAHDELVEVLELLIDNISPEVWEALPQYVQEQVMQAFNNAKAEATHA